MTKLLLILLAALSSINAHAATAWIVLIPGAGSSGDQSYPTFLGLKNRYFGGYQDQLKKDGFDYIICPKTHDKDSRTIEEREEECVQQISALAPRSDHQARDIVILGHSTGGLIARELGQDSRVKDRIKSILLFSTPNQGTIFADYVLDEEAKGFNPSSFMATIAEWTSKKKHYLPELRSVRTGYSAQTFTSQDVIDNPDISYMSFSTSFKNEFTYLDLTRLLIGAELGIYGLADTSYGTQNDGVVPLYSEVYGHYLGNIEISHVEGPCPDFTKHGSACKKSKALVLPALESEASMDQPG
jgi:triacylglycerol esterase/lipase EstA (alpha/beta hydrolase family)